MSGAQRTISTVTRPLGESAACEVTCYERYRSVTTFGGANVRFTRIVDCAGIESPGALIKTSEESNVTVTPGNVVAGSRVAFVISDG
jgi:hypothetical protein